MKRQQRREYEGDRYPTREQLCDRRRFLLGLGKVTGVALVSLSFGRQLRGGDGGGGPRITELPGGTYQVELPGAPDVREVQVEHTPIYYRVTVEVATKDIATYIGTNHLALLGKLDAVLQQYTVADVRTSDRRTEIEGKLLEALRASHCAAVSCKAGDVVSLALTVDQSHHDQTIGCSCASVPLKAP